MEASTLRWILVVVGALVLASIFLFGNPKKEKKPKASRRKKSRGASPDGQRTEPTLEGESAESDAEPITEEQVLTGQGELEIDAPAEEGERREPTFAAEGEVAEGASAEGAVQAPRKPPPPRKPAGPPPDRIVSLFLLARDNHVINGAELLQATVNTGMLFGDMNIFHRVHEASEKTVFSMANAAKPGHFERDEWNTFETNGVVLFMTLPSPIEALDAWDAMLAAGRRMAEVLNADLLDEQRNPFTRQKEAEMREEMRDYQRTREGRD